jgi:hypothetical protein
VFGKTVVVVVTTLLCACTAHSVPSSEPSAPTTSASVSPHTALGAAPRRFTSQCYSALSPDVCPTELPLTDGRDVVDVFRQRNAFVSISFTYGGPYPQLTAKNAPPRFVHIELRTGQHLDVANGAFRFPSVAPREPIDLPDSYPRHAVAIGSYTWGSKSGILVLAPAYPAGGSDGGHLIFRWSSDERHSAISMHAWAPLSDSVAALQQIVASIAP